MASAKNVLVMLSILIVFNPSEQALASSSMSLNRENTHGDHTHFRLKKIVKRYIDSADEAQSTQTANEIATEPSSAYNFYDWNKEEMTAYEYYLTVCTDRCYKGHHIHLNSSFGCPSIECFPCDCNRPSCNYYSTCCPSLELVSTVFQSQNQLALSNGIEINIDKICSENWTETSPGMEESEKIFSPLNISDTNYDCTRNNRSENDRSKVDRSSNHTPKVVCETEENGRSFLHIRSCPIDYTGPASDMSDCEDTREASGVSVLQYRHVSDSSTGVSYYNELCAACNQVAANTTVPWTLHIECKHFMIVYKAIDEDTFLQLSLQPSSTCLVYQSPPSKDTKEERDGLMDDRSSIQDLFTECNPLWYTSSISSCNTTGQLKQNDHELKRACEMMKNPIYKVCDTTESSDTLFMNLFCAICHSGSYPRYYNTCESKFNDGSVPVQTLPFSLLLGTQTRTSLRKVIYSPFAECPVSQWASPDGQCHQLKCTSGKVLGSDPSMCGSALNEISGLGYSLQLYYAVKPKLKLPQNDSFVLRAQSGEDMGEVYLDAFKNKIRELMDLISASGESSYNVITSQKSLIDINKGHYLQPYELAQYSEDIAIEYPDMFTMSSRFTDESGLRRDEFEKIALSELIYSDTELVVSDDHTMVLMPTTVLEGYDLFLHCQLVTQTYNDHTCLSGNLLGILFGIEADSIWASVEDFIPLTPFLNCSYVVFNESQFSISSSMDNIPPEMNVSLYFDEIELNISLSFENDLFELKGESLIVCQNLLQSKVSELDDFFYIIADKNNSIFISQYALTMICVLLSIICLSLTLITYFSFASLRSDAGMNNIFLCLSLLSAQSFLLGASHIDSSGTFCDIVAIFTHFLWLCVFCWSFICCFHMFRIFSAKTRNAVGSAESKKLKLYRHIALCALLPALVVACVVIANLILRNEIGYGEEGCFLDTTHLILLFVIIPLSLTLMCNMFFFGYTIKQIHSVRKLQTEDTIKKSDRQNFYIYIKLSTMTGGFWTLSILAETLDNNPLRYISIILNGLQGVFIFLSYIANKRVLNMYLLALHLKDTPATASSSTDRSTVGRAALAVGKQKKTLEAKNLNTYRESEMITADRKASVESSDSGWRDGAFTLDGDEESTTHSSKTQETLNV